MENFNPEAFHKEYLKTHRPLLIFDENADYFDWKSKVKAKFDEVIRVPEKVIEPRPLIIFGGEKDPIFPFEAAMGAYKNVIEKIYEKEGASEKCRYVHDDCGHEFQPKIAFPAFAEVTGWR